MDDDTRSQVYLALHNLGTGNLVRNANVYHLEVPEKYYKIQGCGWGCGLYQLRVDREMLVHNLAEFILARLPEPTPLSVVTLA